MPKTAVRKRTAIGDYNLSNLLIYSLPSVDTRGQELNQKYQFHLAMTWITSNVYK
jgi:hypothetical protein